MPRDAAWSAERSCPDLSADVARHSVPAFFSIAEHTPIYLVDTQTKLSRVRTIIEGCCFCGLDVEWKPHSRKPRATLVQLACRLSTAEDCVVLLDMLQLPPEDVKDVLQTLFREKGCVKVAFGMETDLLAVAAALGPGGGGCISCVRSQLEIGIVHKHLLRRRVPGVTPVTGSSLSSLAAALLGKPLDKREQCSAWDVRPLTSSQIAYAARDAACLLAMLDRLIEAAHPRSCPMRKAPAAEGSGGAEAAPQQQGSSPAIALNDRAVDGGAGGGASCVGNACGGGRGGCVGPPHGCAHCQRLAGVVGGDGGGCAEGVAALRTGSVASTAHAESVEAAASDVAPSVGGGFASGLAATPRAHNRSASSVGSAPIDDARRSIPSAVEHSSAGDSPAGHEPLTRAVGGAGSGPHAHPLPDVEEHQDGDEAARVGAVAELARAVAECWSHTLCCEANEFRRLEMIKHSRGSRQSASLKADDADEGWPEYIPWEHGTSTEKKFVCDVMLEGLARQLRLYGIDAASTQHRDKTARYDVIRSLLERGLQEDRVVLTSDRLAASSRNSDQCYLVRSSTKRDQLKEVVLAFAIKLDASSLLSRCYYCNGEFYNSPMQSHELPADCVLPAGVRDSTREFWCCRDCHKVYWQGSQYGNAVSTLSSRIDALLLGKEGPSPTRPATVQ